MTKKKVSLEQQANLRRQAEQIVQEKNPQLSENLDLLSPQEQQQLLHELQLHQTELEIQNESLRQTQENLESSKLRYFNLYDLAPVGYFTLNEEGLILEANLTASNLLGVMTSVLTKKSLTHFIFREDQDIYYHHRKQLFDTNAPQVCELRLVKKDNSPFWVRLESTIAQDNENGDKLSYTVISDITERKLTEEKLDKLTRVDLLTDCYNRRYGLELLDRQIKLSQRNKAPLLLAFLDIDKFKTINDTFGHDEGDKVLKEAVGLFQSTLREVDIICRMGGDEFLLAFPDSSLQEASLIRNRIKEELLQLNRKIEKDYNIQLSIGFSEHVPEKPKPLDELIAIADQKMYEEKKRKNKQ